MGGLGTLPSLSPSGQSVDTDIVGLANFNAQNDPSGLSSVGQTQTTSSYSPSSSFTDNLNKLGSLGSSALGAAKSNVQKLIFGVTIEDGIFMLLGLLLIAAGVFAFKTSQTIVQVAGKVGTKAAEAASV